MLSYIVNGFAISSVASGIIYYLRLKRIVNIKHQDYTVRKELLRGMMTDIGLIVGGIFAFLTLTYWKFDTTYFEGMMVWVKKFHLGLLIVLGGFGGYSLRLKVRKLKSSD